MRFRLNTSNSCSYDAFLKKGIVLSADLIPEELLHKIILVRCPDGTIEKRIEALEFSMQFLTDDEMKLLFFRYFQGHSHKTLKKTLGLGSTRTAVKRLAKLIAAIKEYMFYYMEHNYDADIRFIEAKSSKEHSIIAGFLFRRMSRNKVYQNCLWAISRKKLNRIVDEIEMLCVSELRLSGFWRVLRTVGKLK